MFKRPQPGETEEDILRQQEEFLRSKAETSNLPPAATIVKVNSGNQNDHGMDQSEVQMDTSTTLQEQIDNTFEMIPSQINIGQIVEKSSNTCEKPTLVIFPKHAGFPQAARRKENLLAKGHKGSIFSQQIKRMKSNEIRIETEGESPSCSSSPVDVERKLEITENKQSDSIPTSFVVDEDLPCRSYILTGKDKEEIHRENMEVLHKMTEHQILEEREKLLSTMDPAIVAFLKSKRCHQEFKIHEDRTPTVSEKNKAAEEVNVEDIETTAEIVGHYKSDSWLHFDTIEANKLAWMKSVDIPKIKKNDPYEARFDFDGWLLPFSVPDIDEKNRILYHHGDEPGRPGYTLQELFQLCRSSVIQQKILALNTIANLLSLYQSGVYRDILELPIEQIFFVVRFCLDDNTPSILNSCVKAMRNLFYYVVDEICVDNLLTFGLEIVQPILAVDPKETEDDKTVNDQQLAETNLVKCLVRTEILTRIRYIINVVKPPLETIVYCLEILIRLARDSFFIAKEVFYYDNLMKSILNYFMPVVTSSFSISNTYGTPLVQAIKLVRILSSRSSKFASNFVNKYKIMDSLVSYLSSEDFSMNSNGLKLQIESLHLWSVFVHFELALDHFKVLQPILLRMLDFHVRNTSAVFYTSYVVQSHISALLNLISNVSKKDYVCILPYISLLIDPAMFKWTAQFGSQSEYSCGKLQIVSSLLHCFANLFRYKPTNVNLPVDEVETAIQNMITSEGFDVVTKHIEFSSNLLSTKEPQRSSANLKTLEAAIFDATDHIVPVLQRRSCIPFLTSLSEFIDSCECNKTRFVFLHHKNILRYLNLLQKADKFKLSENWFTRIESQLILNILKAAVSIQKEIDTQIFFEVAVKCLSTFNSEQKQDIEFILFNIIFSPRFYPSEVLMQNLGVSDQTSFLKVALDNVNDIFETYAYTLGLKKDLCDFTTNLCVDSSIGNIIPVDWVYSPIIMFYSSQQDKNTPLPEEQQSFFIKNCLRWLCTYEMYFPSLANNINTTDRFCRIACVFLGSDDLFLDQEVQTLMKLCLQSILNSNEKEINFNKPIQGLTNFQDFYTQILEQYQGVSYGNILFGNFILLPLAQKQDKKYRKILWSEYAGILQIFNVTESECLYPMEMFLEPLETDLSLLQCYRRTLQSGMVRKNSVLYTIASHHVKSLTTQNKIRPL
ncbi:RNA polymerase II-associated protein 1 [Agrilus planipennis]|uniref:RNA polymerase II-associated protein 1 n=1 Tax=Agrilus planipennis TaxID=224129 RepID=A0A1W4WTY0_AGRPL|nr:RNA polymerase II-associated protein 1 [Agrilus planipennis]